MTKDLKETYKIQLFNLGEDLGDNSRREINAATISSAEKKLEKIRKQMRNNAPNLYGKVRGKFDDVIAKVYHLADESEKKEDARYSETFYKKFFSLARDIKALSAAINVISIVSLQVYNILN